jgi:NAD(P)-dependent dehydrogenase (short-subunit alcohol dehydrogenase family)
VWLITGCSSGIGRATALAAARRGDRVLATARDEGAVRALHDAHPSLVSTHALDVTDDASIEAVCAYIDANVGSVDVLVNNAGRGFLGPLEETTDADLRRVFDTNVFGTMALTRAVLARMRPARRGHIVFVTSLGAMLAPPFVGAYASSKAAADRLAVALAAELRPFGIRVSSVLPGLFRTNFRHRGIDVADSVLADYADAFGRLTSSVADDYPATAGDPDDAAGAILQLVDAGAEAPMRLLLGADALAAATATIDRSRTEIDAWAEVSRLSGEGADNLTAYLGDPS